MKQPIEFLVMDNPNSVLDDSASDREKVLKWLDNVMLMRGTVSAGTIEGYRLPPSPKIRDYQQEYRLKKSSLF